MSDYLNGVLDWLDANAAANNIEKWFFFTSFREIVTVGEDGYMGITFFDDKALGRITQLFGPGIPSLCAWGAATEMQCFRRSGSSSVEAVDLLESGLPHIRLMRSLRRILVAQFGVIRLRI